MGRYFNQILAIQGQKSGLLSKADEFRAVSAPVALAYDAALSAASEVAGLMLQHDQGAKIQPADIDEYKRRWRWSLRRASALARQHSVLAELRTERTTRHAGLVPCAIFSRQAFSFVNAWAERPRLGYDGAVLTIHSDMLRVQFQKPTNERADRPQRGLYIDPAIYDDCDPVPAHLQVDKNDPERRGIIRGFSARSRHRMISDVAKTRGVGAGGLFGTLTFSDVTLHEYPEQDELYKFAHRCLKVLKQRLERSKYGKLWGWWKFEIVERKSGDFVGRKAPHFHLLIYGVPDDLDLMAFRDWISENWFEVVGSNDPEHKAAGTQVAEVASRRKAYWYMSKAYAMKQNDIEAPEWEKEAAGRRWGQFGALDQDYMMQITITKQQWVELKRQIARWMGARERERVKAGKPVRQYAKRLARSRSSLGASVFALGMDTHDFDTPTVIKMMAMAGIPLPRWASFDPVGESWSISEWFSNLKNVQVS